MNTNRNAALLLEMMSFGDRSQAAAGGGAPAGVLPNQRVPSGLNSMSTGYSQTGNVGANMGVTVNSTGYSSRSSSAQVGQGTPMSGNVGYSSIQASHNNSYPISPDVRLKKLPFYDILGELLKPSTLAPPGSGRYQEGTFTFSLTPQQANKIAHSRDLRPGKQDYSVQVQMRFCLLETTCEQEDNFPPNITVKINDKMCPLPSPIPTNKAGVEPKRPSRPVNVTALCRISPTVTNRIMVTWSSDYGRCYVISVYLVQKLTSEDLLQRLKSKGPRLADFTRSLIKQKLREDGECEIATTSLRCSLLCPLGKMRMMLPCRAETCNHLQCFDASLFLQMNERKPTWTCPVCDRVALYDNLVIDGYFQEVLQANDDCTEVTLQKDGGWIPLIQKKEKQEQPAEKRKTEVAVVETLSDDSDDSDGEAVKADNDDSVVEEVRSKRKQADVEIITLSDSDDETSSPPSKRAAYQSTSSSSVLSHTSNSSTATLTTADTSGNGTSTTAANNGSGGAASCASSGSVEANSPDNSVPVGECTKSNDSWRVGEVDPGKRLIFRKSLSSSSSTSGGLITPNNGVPNSTTSPGSSRSASPQVICLDSPVSTPAHSPRAPVAQEDPSQNVSSGVTSSAIPSTTPILSPVPASTSSSATCAFPVSSPASVAASLASLGSELTPINSGSASIPLSSPPVPVTITSVPNSSISPSDLTTTGNAYNIAQDPLSPNFNMNSLSPSPNLAHAYGVSSGLQNIFNPMSMIAPASNADINFRPQDRFL